MDDPRASRPAWAQPDSLGVATSQRWLHAGVIAAAPGMPRIRHAGAIGERHLAFVDSLSVAASLWATSAVGADDPRVFRGASRHGSGGVGEAWPTPSVARAVVAPLARASAAPRGVAALADEAPPGPPEAADASPAVARAVAVPVATASGALHGTSEPAVTGAGSVSDSPGVSGPPGDAVPAAPVAVLRRSDPVVRGGATAATAAGTGGPGSPRVLAAAGLLVDARSSGATPLAPSVSARSLARADRLVGAETPLARAARPQAPGATSPGAGRVDAPDAGSAADGAVRVMPQAAPPEQVPSLPLAHASLSPPGGAAVALDGGSGVPTPPGRAATLPAIARSASPAHTGEAATLAPHERDTGTGTSTGSDGAQHASSVGTVGEIARAAAPHVELPLRVQRVPGVVQAMPTWTAGPQSAAATGQDATPMAAAPGLSATHDAPLAARLELPRGAGLASDPVALSRRAAAPLPLDLSRGTPAFTGPGDHAPSATGAAAEGAHALPVVRAQAASPGLDDGSGGSTLARRFSAVVAPATGNAATAPGLPIWRAPQGDAVASGSTSSTAARVFRATADIPDAAPLAQAGPSAPRPDAADAAAAGATVHRSAGAAPPRILARVGAAVPMPAPSGPSGSLAQARRAPAAPSIAMPLVAHRATFGADAATPNSAASIARSPDSAAASSSSVPLIDAFPATTAQHPDPSTSSPTAAAGVDVDDLVERACQAVFARLVIEQERRGYARWA